MLLPRIIPSLLIHNKGLVKTTKFSKPKYVGDPLNAVKIFNEKLVDELIIMDIDASVNHCDPDFSLIEKIAIQCRMPLCYGGGIKNIEHAKKLLSLGVEKIAISSLAIENPSIIKDFSNFLGSQSVVVVLDVKKKLFGDYEILIHNGTKMTGLHLTKFIKTIEENGAGEIVLNSIDKDGMMSDYDYNLIDIVRKEHSLPMTILGGAGNLDHIKNLIDKYEIIGCAAGSLFVFKGKYRAVLINYPNQNEKESLISNII